MKQIDGWEKLTMQSEDKVASNVEKIAALFPNCLTERYNEQGQLEHAIDFDKLKQELSDSIVSGREERYEFTWPDKRKAMLAANAPINKTLRPCREESVDFDNTQNLYIEGDNLEVLKLLQETYRNKVKMIYIDPPYNTGNDFVYEDDFAQDVEEYKECTGLFDENGNRLFDGKYNKNPVTNGRFHTDWLNMMYPRLKLAKDLLSEDGVIFISIGVEEFDNMKKVCSEIFGDSNFIEIFSWVKTSTPPSLATKSRKTNEYILCYEKNKSPIKYNGEVLDGGDQPLLNTGNKITSLTFPKNKVLFKKDKFPDGIYEPYFSGKVTLLDKIEIKNGYATSDFRLRGEFKWTQDTLFSEISNGTTFIIKSELLSIRFIREGDGYKRPINFIKDKYLSPLINKEENSVGTNENASSDLKILMGNEDIFPYSKPTSLIMYLANFICASNDTIIDFFSGSATTAHAVMQLNAEDEGKRKFIMVQLPELCDEKSEAYKAGYKNICEIGKERIRRAGKKIKEDNPLTTQELDIGFRVLKCDSSNMKDVYYTPIEYTKNLFDSLEDNIKKDRTPEDLLFQVMLGLGIELSEKIVLREIAGKKVYYVNDNYLLACFDDNVTEEVVTAIAKQTPYYFVMRDSSLASDSVAANFRQIFDTYSPQTQRKVL